MNINTILHGPKVVQIEYWNGYGRCSSDVYCMKSDPLSVMWAVHPGIKGAVLVLDNGTRVPCLHELLEYADWCFNTFKFVGKPWTHGSWLTRK